MEALPEEILALGNWLIAFIYGEEFLPALPILFILLVGFGLANIFYWNRAALLAFDYPVFPTVVNFIGMLFKIGGILLFGAQYGAVAFAALLAGYYIFTVGIAALRVRVDLQQKLTADRHPSSA